MRLDDLQPNQFLPAAHSAKLLTKGSKKLNLLGCFLHESLQKHMPQGSLPTASAKICSLGLESALNFSVTSPETPLRNTLLRLGKKRRGPSSLGKTLYFTNRQQYFTSQHKDSPKYNGWLVVNFWAPTPPCPFLVGKRETPQAQSFNPPLPDGAAV